MSETKTVWIKDLKPDGVAQELFMIQELKEGLAKNNKPFLTITIADKTGTLEIKQWESTKAGFPHKIGEIVYVEFSTEEYKGKLQGKLIGTSPAPYKAYAPDFIRASKHDPDVMWSQFEKYLNGFHHEHFRQVAGDLFDPPSQSLFRDAPAATGMHHAFKHGLLEHTLQMLQIGEKVLDFPFFEDLNYDLCMFGLMFHDFGKIYEYSLEPGYKKRLQGYLVPHIPMVAARILESANKFCVPEMVRDHMMHVVLAHHRFLEWGSPVKFACPEAAFIHHIDNLHGDVFGILQKRAEATEDTVKHGFYDDTVTVLRKPFNTIIAEAKGVEGGF